MAQRVVTHLEDDIDGGDATETVAFGLDGTQYEIDLNDDNAAKLRDALAPYLGAARRAGGGGRGGRSNARSAAPRQRSGDSDAGAIRAWAESNGIEVSARGRISADLREKYEAAQKKRK